MSYGSGHNNRSNPLRSASGDKPKREVYPTSEVPHKWAHATQSRARNAQGNLFFDGDTIYSYLTSWPIAHIYGRKIKGALFAKDNPACNLVLVNSERYSVTTAQHTSQVERAVSHLPCIRVPHVAPVFSRTYPEHAENLKYLTSESAAQLALAQRAMTIARVEYYLAGARDRLADATRYMDFFGIRRVRPVFPEADAARALARVQAILNPDPARDAAKIKARARNAAKRRAALQGFFDVYAAQVAEHNLAARAYLDARALAEKNLPDAAVYWREHGTWPRREHDDKQPRPPYTGYKMEHKYTQAGFEMPDVVRIPYAGRLEEVLLRVVREPSRGIPADGGTIQTSLGARVPLAAAPMVWNLVRRAMRNGGYTPSGLSRIMIGDYPLDRIDADGTLRAGCHTIKFAELELLARSLGLTDAEE